MSSDQINACKILAIDTLFKGNSNKSGIKSLVLINQSLEKIEYTKMEIILAIKNPVEVLNTSTKLCNNVLLLSVLSSILYNVLEKLEVATIDSAVTEKPMIMDINPIIISKVLLVSA